MSERDEITINAADLEQVLEGFGHDYIGDDGMWAAFERIKATLNAHWGIEDEPEKPIDPMFTIREFPVWDAVMTLSYGGDTFFPLHAGDTITFLPVSRDLSGLDEELNP